VVQKLVDLIDPNARPLFGSIPERALEQTRVAVVERSYQLLGWRMQTSLAEGLRRTVDWYRGRA
jgi:nucleoside-diphosphate-sugar epimerase